MSERFEPFSRTAESPSFAELIMMLGASPKVQRQPQIQKPPGEPGGFLHFAVLLSYLAIPSAMSAATGTRNGAVARTAQGSG